MSKEELIALGMYYNRPSEELIFLTEKEHQNAHHKGKKRSMETRKKISESNKGKPTWNKGKSRTWYTNGNKGMHWYNNGIVQMQSFECPNGFVKGMLPR